MRRLGQRGFTLVEVLVGTGIMSLMTTLMGTSEKTGTSFEAQADTRNVSEWIGRDLPMAQATDLVDGGAPVGSASFTWVDQFGGVQLSHSVSYSLAGGELVRTYDGISHVIGRQIS